LKALGLVFSARKHGNCYDCVNYCLERLRKEGIETRLISMYDYRIEPCSHCDYECFSERIRGTKETCPISDNLPKIYHEFKDSDIVVFGVPTYVGQVPSLFRIFEERSLGIYGFGEHMKVLEGKTYGFIVLNSYFALEEAMRRFYGSSPAIAWLLLRSREYGLDPLKTGLIENPDVRNRLNTFTESLMKLSKQKV